MPCPSSTTRRETYLPPITPQSVNYIYTRSNVITRQMARDMTNNGIDPIFVFLHKDRSQCTALLQTTGWEYNADYRFKNKRSFQQNKKQTRRTSQSNLRQTAMNGSRDLQNQPSSSADNVVNMTPVMCELAKLNLNTPYNIRKRKWKDSAGEPTSLGSSCTRDTFKCQRLMTNNTTTNETPRERPTLGIVDTTNISSDIFSDFSAHVPNAQMSNAQITAEQMPYDQHTNDEINVEHEYTPLSDDDQSSVHSSTFSSFSRTSDADHPLMPSSVIGDCPFMAFVRNNSYMLWNSVTKLASLLHYKI